MGQSPEHSSKSADTLESRGQLTEIAITSEAIKGFNEPTGHSFAHTQHSRYTNTASLKKQFSLVFTTTVVPEMVTNSQ